MACMSRWAISNALPPYHRDHEEDPCGIIGKPYYGKAWYRNLRKSIGIGKQVPVPEHLDWDLWQGPAPRRPYKDNIHPYNWHWFWHWGTGETLNNGTHEVDLCLWAMRLGWPKVVTASGGRYHFKDDWEFYDTLVTSYEYDNAMITWESLSCQGKQAEGKGRGALIHGTDGSVFVDRTGYRCSAWTTRRLTSSQPRRQRPLRIFGAWTP
jgi:predicted dehydrogenase